MNGIFVKDNISQLAIWWEESAEVCLVLNGRKGRPGS